MKNNPEFNRQIFEKIQKFLLNNNFHLSLDAHNFDNNSNIAYTIKISNNVTSLRTIELLTLNKSNSYGTEQDIYKQYSELFIKDIENNYDDELFRYFFTATKNNDFIGFFSDDSVKLRYLTHPKVMQAINLKTLKKHCRLLKNDDDLSQFLNQLKTLPYWQENIDFLKDFLLNNNFQPIYKKLFGNNEHVSFIIEKEPLKTYTCDINFSMLSINDKLTGRHSFAKMNAFLGVAVRDFHAYKPADCLIEGILFDHLTPKENYKQMVFVTQDTGYAKAFAQVFIERLHEVLKDNSYVSDKSETTIGREMSNILEETQVLFLKNKLESDLVSSKNNTKFNKI